MASLLFLVLNQLTSPTAHAREVALYVDLYRAEDVRLFSHAVESLWFRSKFLGRRRARPVVIRGRTEAEVTAKFRDLSLAPDEHIVAAIFDGHGHCGRVGHIFLDDAQSRLNLRRLRGKFAPDAQVIVLSCAFVPKPPRGARATAQELADELGLRGGRIFAYFENVGFPDHRPFWKLKNPPWPAVAFQIALWVSPVVSLAAAVSHHPSVGVGSGAFFALGLVIKMAQHRLAAARPIAYEFAIRNTRVLKPVVVDWLSFGRTFWRRLCESRLAAI